MKKILFLLAVALLAFAAVGCSGALHNTPASYVNFEVENFPGPDGEYAIAGSFPENEWNNGERKFEITDGAGSYEEEDMIISSSLSFSLVEFETWSRDAWYGEGFEGNEDDFGNMQNFNVTVPMDGQVHTITIDFGEAVDKSLDEDEGLSVE